MHKKQLTLTRIITRLAGILTALFVLALAAGGQVVPAAAEAATSSPRFMTTVVLTAAFLVIRSRYRTAVRG